MLPKYIKTHLLYPYDTDRISDHDVEELLEHWQDEHYYDILSIKDCLLLNNSVKLSRYNKLNLYCLKHWKEIEEFIDNEFVDLIFEENKRIEKLKKSFKSVKQVTTASIQPFVFTGHNLF